MCVCAHFCACLQRPEIGSRCFLNHFTPTPASLPPVLGLQVCTAMLDFYVDAGIELGSSCLCSRHFTQTSLFSSLRQDFTL